MGALQGVVAIGLILYLIGSLVPPLSVLLVLYFVMRPFDERRYVAAACFVQGSWLNNMVYLMESLLGVQLNVTGELPPREPALVLANHLTHDWAPMYSLAYRMGTLANVRTVIKKSASYVPGFGWGMTLCYWPFVTRDFKRDESTLGKLFAAYKRAELPVQLWVFPEGTRLTPKKLAESQEHARAKGYPVWQHVMLPRHRGFITALNALKGVVSVVHEVTLQYEGWGKRAPGLWQIVTSDPKKRHVMHVNIKRISVSEIPEDDAGRQKWLQESFTRREALLAEYAANGKFPGANLVRPYNPKKFVPHLVGWFLCSVVSYGALLAFLLR